MPVWLRRFHIQKINEYNKQQNDQLEESQKGNSNPSDVTRGPNVTPSSTYNFKK